MGNNLKMLLPLLEAKAHPLRTDHPVSRRADQSCLAMPLICAKEPTHDEDIIANLYEVKGCSFSRCNIKKC